MATRIIPKTLGGKLKEAREAKRLLQSEVAKSTGIKQSVISKYENNEVKKPTKKILQQFAELYEVEISYLTTDYYSFDHFPHEIKLWASTPECMPFILTAYADYLKSK